jgi:viroplasmin and RNaseH domain-containing protein
MYHILRNYINWKKSLRTVYSNLTYCSSYILVVETTMVWYVVFRNQKPGVYESWVVCIEYVVGFSGAAFQSYSTRMQAEEVYQTFLEHIIEKGEHVSNKWCFKRLGDISAVCSHCGLTVQDHVTYMFVIVELCTKF